MATGMSALQMLLMLVVVFFVEAWLFWFLLVEILVLTLGIALYALWRKSRFLAKLEQEQRARRGPPPDPRLRPAWREAFEDVVWSLVNHRDFVWYP